jgi:hypothetical protein
MGLCPAQCTDGSLTGIPGDICPTFTTRNKAMSRLGLMLCGISLPSEFTQETVQPLFDSKEIVLSSVLRNFQWSDPETEDVIIHDCAPPQKQVTKRTLSFEDVIAISVTSGSPATVNKYFDYDFWKDKKDKRLLLRYGIVYCNNDFKFARNADGSLMEAWFDVILSGQRLNNGGGTVEFKKGTIDFAGDPLADFAAPDFNLTELGITGI